MKLFTFCSLKRVRLAAISSSILASWLFSPSTSQAASNGEDSALSPAYVDGWNTGDNGGTGFAPWSLIPSDSGAVFTISDDQWAMDAGTGSSAIARRALTGGALSIGQTIAFDYYGSGLTAGASAGIQLQNSSGELLWGFNYQGGFATYTITDSSGSGRKSASVTNLGVHIEFTLTSMTAYTVTVTPLNLTAPTTTTGTLIAANGGAEIAQIQMFFNGNAPSSGTNQQSFNNLVVVPEPSTSVLAAIAGGVAFLRRRQR